MTDPTSPPAAATSRTRYLGLDLAWGDRTGSGVCVLDADGRLLDEAWRSGDALRAWIRDRRGDRSLLAIDAPLVVPADGKVWRPVERELHHRYGRFHAGPFPGGAGSLAMRGRTDAPAAALVAAIDPATAVDPFDTDQAHRAIEVFPAPTWIEVFGLQDRIVYKSARGDARRAVLARLISHLDALATADPPLLPDPRHDLRATLAAARTSTELKTLEDRIDARLCAWVGLAFDRAGRPPAWVLPRDGDRRDGHVVIPQLHPDLAAVPTPRRTREPATLPPARTSPTPTLEPRRMSLLKLPKYVELPDHEAPVTGLKPGDVAEYVILTNFRDHVLKAATLFESVSHEVSGGWDVTTLTGIHAGKPVTVCCAGIGAGQTSNVMEELINLGGRVFLQIGATGAIQEHIGMGDVIIPTGSVRDEGLTRYYAPPQYPAVSDHRVVGALARAARDRGNTVHTGVIRTTDGFYPSQRIDALVEQYHALGVLSVEQEVAAILTVAATRGCYAGAALLVIGNLVTGEHSFNGDRPDLVETAWFEQTRFVLDAIETLRGELDLSTAGPRDLPHAH